jgi:putative nucleotidyltransferase with HDIG domain
LLELGLLLEKESKQLETAKTIKFSHSLFFKITLPLVGIMVLSTLVLGGFLRYSMDSTVTTMLKRDVTASSEDISALLQSRIENVNSAADILSANPEIASALQKGSSESLINMDSRAVVFRDRFELDILQIYDAKQVARTNIVQSSLYQVSSLINIIPSDHADLYLIKSRLVFLSRREVQGGGVVVVGIDILSELERLAHQFNLRDQILLREGGLSNHPIRYVKNEFSLETFVPIGSKTVVFTLTRNTEQLYAVAETAQNVLTISLLLIGFLLILMTMFVIRNIVNPIRNLSVATHEIANTDFQSPFIPRNFFDKKHNPFNIGFEDEISQLANSFSYMENELHTAYTGLINDLKNANIDLNNAYDETLQGWSSALELRDHETERHTSRVAKHAQELASYIGLSEKEITNIRRGAFLHDVGKMAIPDNILNKPGALTDEEWSIMRQHSLYGYVMLRPIEYLKDALDVPYCHHEKWDGTGYPRGLGGDDIPLLARIFSLVDVWDAITSDRPYRTAWSQEDALAYIKAGSGKEFDPKIVEKFFEWLDIKNMNKLGKVIEIVKESVDA